MAIAWLHRRFCADCCAACLFNLEMATRGKTCRRGQANGSTRKRVSRVRLWHKLALSGASSLAIATAVAGWYEGRPLHAYADVGGVPTICYGHTANVKPGETATPEQCAKYLTADMAKARAGVDSCITKPMTNGQEAAFSDLAYNIGWPTFCRSSVARKFNAGDKAGACTAIKHYNKASGKVLPGLVKRRASEYSLCMDTQDQ